MEYKAFGPDAEVLGGAMLAFIKSINYENFSDILKQHGIDEIDPDKWYPQQMWLDIFSDISTQNNATSNMVSIGMLITQTAPVPNSENLTFIELMENFDKAYTANNRGGDIGTIEARVVNEKHITMVDKTPYPDAFVYGAYYGMAKRFLPHGTQFVVEYDTKIPRRERGGEATIVHITWS